jgi:hypothetical protein
VAFYSARSVIQRYVQHSDGPELQIRALTQQLAAAVNQANHSNPETAAAAAQLSRFWLSPDGAATVALLTAALFAVSVVLFAAAGGAIGARIVSLGKRTQRSSQ